MRFDSLVRAEHSSGKAPRASRAKASSSISTAPVAAKSISAQPQKDLPFHPPVDAVRKIVGAPHTGQGGALVKAKLYEHVSGHGFALSELTRIAIRRSTGASAAPGQHEPHEALSGHRIESSQAVAIYPPAASRRVFARRATARPMLPRADDV